MKEDRRSEMRLSLIHLHSWGKSLLSLSKKLEPEIEAVKAVSCTHPEEIELVTLTQSNVVSQKAATIPD